MEQITVLIFWVLLADSLVANLLAWFGGASYFNRLQVFSRYFPITRGWTSWYLVLVVWIGYLTFS